MREARTLRGWSQEELAERTGISKNTILRWENDQISDPDPLQVRRAAEALSVDIEDAFRALGWLPERRPDDGGAEIEAMPDYVFGRAQARQLKLDILHADVSAEEKLRLLDKLEDRLRELGETEAFLREIRGLPVDERSRGTGT